MCAQSVIVFIDGHNQHAGQCPSKMPGYFDIKV